MLTWHERNSCHFHRKTLVPKANIVHFIKCFSNTKVRVLISSWKWAVTLNKMEFSTWSSSYKRGCKAQKPFLYIAKYTVCTKKIHKCWNGGTTYNTHCILVEPSALSCYQVIWYSQNWRRDFSGNKTGKLDILWPKCFDGKIN